MKPLVAILLSVGLWGCTRVNSADLAGTWVLSTPSPSRMHLDPDKKVSIVLDKTGTFVALNLPGFLDVDTTSGNGRWRLVASSGKQQVQLDFANITGWGGALPYGAQLQVTGNGLYYFIGDPDEAKRVLLQKQ